MIFAMTQFLGLYLLAASMRQHRSFLLGDGRRVPASPVVAIAGWSLLAGSLVMVIGGHRAIDIVAWFGLLPLACGMILLGLSFAPRALRALIAAGLAGGLVALFF